MIDLGTIAGLYEHEHSLWAYCANCDRWSAFDLAGLIAAGQGSRRLPLLYPLGRSRTLPEIHYLSAADAERIIPVARAGKLEPEPFLELLPVYRYRSAPRRR